jgi:hypothetical protein
MKILKLLLTFFFLSCFDPEKNSDNKVEHYTEIWKSWDKIKKVHSFRVIKINGRVVGYIDEDYAHIFKNKEQQESETPLLAPTEKVYKEENNLTPATKIEKPQKGTTHPPKFVPKIKKTQKETAHSPKISLPNLTKSNTPLPDVSQKDSPNVPDQAEAEKDNVTSQTTDKNAIDFTQLDLYYSDLKFNKSTSSGSFKINLKNNTGKKLPETFFQKLIYQIKVFDGNEEKVIITNYSGLGIDQKSLWAIKNSFHKDLNVTIKFRLLGIKTAKIKISFCAKDDPSIVCPVKNVGDDFITLEV